MSRRKVCYITGTRADFGLMQSTLQRIHRSNLLELSMIVTGMHLLPEYGLTVSQIEAAGLPVTARIAVEEGLPSRGPDGKEYWADADRTGRGV